MKYLFVGLGNIGQEYEFTRHNVGFRILDQLALEHKAIFDQDKYVHIANFRYHGKIFYLIKPTTYMNQSGKAVRYWIKKINLPVDKLLVLVDDIFLPFGKLRLRLKGSSAGHNGLKDIELHLQTQDYARLKFGIGDGFHAGEQANYVLNKFNKIEESGMTIHLQNACKMAMDFVLKPCLSKPTANNNRISSNQTSFTKKDNYLA